MAGRKRLTREDWAAAALTALGEGGLSAVAVEPIAVRLGATKGSFYWHFANRDALVEAALTLWEQRNTTDVITAAAAAPDALGALRALVSQVLHSATAAADDPGAVEPALQAGAGHPLVGPTLERVSRRRLEHLQTMFAELGFDRDEAARRGLAAFTAYLGHVQIARATPALLPRGADLTAYIDSLITTLTTPGSTRGAA
ncbi:MAG: TetR/AcrR family transcriptional regulator [Pseudonocardia sp.]|nr:TetR/AcrR family transcriptional regulator [Pseudonocardia sp.]